MKKKQQIQAKIKSSDKCEKKSRSHLNHKLFLETLSLIH